MSLVMFRLSPIIECRSIIAKNSDYRSKISKIDHRKQIIYEMRNGENRMHSVRIGYHLQYGGAHSKNNAFNKRYGGRVTREGHLPNFIMYRRMSEYRSIP